MLRLNKIMYLCKIKEKTKMESLSIQNTALLVHIEHSKPIDINDFTKTLNAVGNLYSRFAQKSGATSELANAKLYVEKIQEGSIDVLLSLSGIVAVLPLLDGFNTIMEFGKYLHEVLQYFKTGEGEKPNLETKDYEDLHNIVSITAKDRGSVTNITVIDKREITNNYYGCPMDFNTGNSLQNQAKEGIENIKESEIENCVYKNVLMKIYQIRNDNKKQSGNKAIISNISKNKINIFFDTEELKEQILYMEDTNPIHKLFVVDVEIQTIEGKIKAYKIMKLHEILDDDEE